MLPAPATTACSAPRSIDSRRDCGKRPADRIVMGSVFAYKAFAPANGNLIDALAYSAAAATGLQEQQVQDQPQ